MPKPDEKARQEAEAEARNEGLNKDPKKGPVDDQPDDLAQDGDVGEVDTDKGGEIDAAGEEESGKSEKKATPPRLTPNDARRAEMAKKFANDREGAEEGDGDVGDVRKAVGADNMPPKKGAEAAETGDKSEQDDKGETAAKPAEARKVKLKVYGKEEEVTEEEAIALAQQARASQTILGRAQEEARQIVENARRTADSRAKPAREDETGDKTKPEGEGSSDDAANQRDDYEDALHEFQFGDPKEAAPKFRKLVETAGRQQAERLFVDQQIIREERSERSAVEQFNRDNPDLSTKPFEREVYRAASYMVMRDELVKAGLKPEQIAADNEAMMQQHRFLRIQGTEGMSKPVDVLAKAKATVQEHFSGGAKPKGDKPDKPKVDVDRTARRANLSSQPTHAARSPRGNGEDTSASKAPTPSEVIKGMRRARHQPVA